MKKLLILFTAVLTAGIQQVSAVQYQKSFYFGQSNQHSYSVTESVTTAGNIVTAGTVCRNNGQPTDSANIHLQEVTPAGVVVWSRIIIGSGNDYCMNINKISGGYILTGYQQISTGQNRAAVWIVNSTGSILQQRTYTHPTLTAHSTYAMHGFQASDGRYIVSGFVSAGQTAAAAKQGMVLKLGSTLTVTWARFLNTPNSTTTDHDMCEFGIETPSGYFFTGSQNISSTSARQGVLAVWLNPSTGAIVANNSFINTTGNSRECGASACYSAATNKLYLLFNNSFIHCFGIAEFTGTTYTSNTLFTGTNFNYQGFSIRISQHNADELIVAGMTQSVTVPVNQTNSSTPFMVEINRTSYAILGEINYLLPSTGFNVYGGFFKYFDGQQPYIYSPEIMAWSTPSTKEISLLGYRRQGGGNKYRLEIINNIPPVLGDVVGGCGYNQLGFTKTSDTWTILPTPATTTSVANQASTTVDYRVDPTILDCNRDPSNCVGQVANAGPDIICPPAQIGTPAIAGCTYSWSGTGTLSAYNIAQPVASTSGGTFLLTMVNACGEVSFDVVVVFSNIAACRQANPNAANAAQITFYPNPASETVTLEWAVPAETVAEVRVMDVTGRQVIAQNVAASNTSLNVSALPQGLYVCQFVLNGEVVKTERLVVNH
ncbi:MAG: T9SS type A sorting domain-containing protein [Bacteroidia bacterium]|nr:T9SS type A sorting domain-containing protein [Bacteroidia bacterium]